MNTKDEIAFRDACVTFDGDDAIRWIVEHYNPSDVFNERLLKKHVSTNWQPEDIFDEKALAEWARLNGWVKEGGAP